MLQGVFDIGHSERIYLAVWMGLLLHALHAIEPIFIMFNLKRPTPYCEADLAVSTQIAILSGSDQEQIW